MEGGRDLAEDMAMEVYETQEIMRRKRVSRFGTGGVVGDAPLRANGVSHIG